MRKSFFLNALAVIVFGVSAFCTSVSGQGQKPAVENVPPIVVDGLDALRQFGPDEAAKAWSKGSRWEGSSDHGLANTLRLMQESFGAFRSSEILSVRPLSGNTRIIYLTLNYEKEPRFAKFLIYHTAHSWIMLSYYLDGNADWLQAELK